ncbi:MAG: arylsulfatase [Pirellulales bacterium]|nr:arylsulfatase [Pirellulales bacterium]
MTKTLAFLLAVLLTAWAVAAQRPNVLLIMSDDQGYGEFSCHGNPVLRTPNLDAFARQSVRFTDFHVAPMCTPTRGQLLTGQDAFRNHAMNVSSGRSLLNPNLPTLANYFAAAGYRTALFGKWHLGDNYPYRPQDRGFQESLWFPCSLLGSVPDFWANDYFDDTYYHNGKRQQFPGYCTDLFFQRATDWIKTPSDSAEKPFFLYLPLNAPHGPHFVEPKYSQPIREAIDAAADKLPKLSEEQRANLARYLGMIANIDENFGHLLEFLDDRKLAENTIIIFLTDNGSTMGPLYYNAGMRGGKTTLWEGGHRVPCFVRWPNGNLGSPRDLDELTCVQDLLPTLLELCGISPDKFIRLDGTSLAPLLQGKEKNLPDRKLVINYSRMPVSLEGEPASIPRKLGAAVLWKKWRLLEGTQLYNLADDPIQQHDIHEQHPDITSSLRNHLDQWWLELASPSIPLTSRDGPDRSGLAVAKEGSLSPSDPSEPIARPERIIIGHPTDNPTTLSTSDWLDVFLDVQGGIRNGLPRNGTWHLIVDHPGQYNFQLRRWPAEAKLPLAEPSPEIPIHLGRHAPGKALPIHAARIEIAGQQHSQSAKPNAHSIDFTLTLPAGPCELRTTFLDDEDKELCGAYYVTVSSLTD